MFKEGELEPKSVCAKFAHTAADRKTYQVDHYNLDVIISVGYRVKSLRHAVPHLGHPHARYAPARIACGVGGANAARSAHRAWYKPRAQTGK